MNQIGPEVEERREQLGLSRKALAKLVGVSAQTILNMERGHAQTLNLRLLGKLERALRVEFTVVMKKKEHTMRRDITMGNDEFILYVRKNHPACSLSNRLLGKRIWAWLQSQDGGAAKIAEEPAPCLWGSSAQNLSENNLPASATQFSFDRAVLPELYDFLDRVGAESGGVD